MPLRLSKKSVLLILWVSLIASAIWYWLQSGIALQEVPAILDAKLNQFGIVNAAIIYIVLYTVRPIILFPGTLLTVSSGLIFGPVLGIVLTTIGGNLSANFAFWIARCFRKGAGEGTGSRFVSKWDAKLKENGFITVLLMRLLYLPFDGVNYGCGLTSMRQRDFALGTFIGILPGLATFALLGGTASAEASSTITIGGFSLSGRAFVFALSAIFFVLGLVIAKLLKKYSTSASAITKNA